VTLISGEYPPMRGGVADYTALLAAGLIRLGVDVSVLTSTRAGGTHAIDSPRVSASVDGWGAALWSGVRDHVEQFRSDVLHVQYQTGAFDMKLAVNLLPWLNRVRGGQPRLVVTFHDLKEPYLLPKLGPLRHLATHLLAAGADATVATNAEDFARLAGRGADGQTAWSWGRRPLRAIPIGSNVPERPPVGYDRTAWRERLGIRNGEVVLAYFGFINPSKGFDTLVAAFESLVQRGSPVRLLVIGATAGDSGSIDRHYENRARERLDQPLVRGRVGWTGFIQASDVAACLRAADLCVLPFREGVSLRHGTLIAAVVHQLPIITTSRASAPTNHAFPRFQTEENALLVPPGDPAALSRAIERAVADRVLRERLSRGAGELAAAFQWDAIASQTLQLYDEVCRSEVL